ncbi:aminomethyl-transferring glycine dehydrogenase [Usitatibacter palustris]|uniref:Glycine dehydrogenase (decarboxylating) n=1 Tax=Usitatibacter palustris TaxID=2732487 RepID=A0A6M4H701_9PROT|nr:aminomethyl-transferring glycine dehydrogenase [Usitatibacter palustris]QJR15409.1 Glycine dehydrogenase (decarboxylating) [Usitatibacter palustris]
MDTHAKAPAQSLAQLEDHGAFERRHIGPDAVDEAQMLGLLGYGTRAALIDAVVPPAIRRKKPMQLRTALNEAEALAEIRRLAAKNQVFRSFIGQGYYGTHTPGVILRNILENPAWYTAYTPYQPEISQGRLEALLNFQTMVTDLTGMAIANASMLDEATAAAEAMTLCLRSTTLETKVFAVADDVFPQTLDVILTRAKPLGIEVQVLPSAKLAEANAFAVLVQYPGVDGETRDFHGLAANVHARGGLVIAAADLLALTLITSPGEWGADVAVGSAQRFGVPMGFGGPHAGYMATRDELKRSMPGRLVGVTVDARGQRAYRLALQTREQHIRREKATSNICTAQVLLAVMASMYAVYHGPQGLAHIAHRVHRLTAILKAGLVKLGFTVPTTNFFDTLTIATGDKTKSIVARAEAAGVNLRMAGVSLGISLDETTTRTDVESLWAIFAGSAASFSVADLDSTALDKLDASIARKSEYLTHPVFNRYHSETEMLRYLRSLADKDLALDRSMIPLGSCTMKLNATSEMIPVTWPEFGAIHPFAPVSQWQGYSELVTSLERMLCEATGYAAVSLQPNAGSQGEYAGLLIIKAWHESRGEGHRNVCLIPSSAHGTNPASAQMVGMQVVVVACDAQGNVDLADLRKKAEAHAQDLAAIMVTYPSTHGVFEAGITEICEVVHKFGGQVYVDGANMNAMVGLTAPGQFGGDVSHLNLHKTFCIPHGGGGPGVGPVAVGAHLAKFLPGHRHLARSPDAIGAVSAAPFGSASILPISWMYVAMMGGEGLTRASEVAILNANYIAKRLGPHYPVLYSGPGGLVAHECILDLRPLKETSGISVEDVAKRLIDYGFHAPTMSFPVAGTLMVEPTESESKAELDRFCEAMIAIREEIRAVEEGAMDREDNPLKHSPHTAEAVLADDWSHKYSRERAAYPLASLRAAKYWSPVARADNVYGDRNLFCSCVPITE